MNGSRNPSKTSIMLSMLRNEAEAQIFLPLGNDDAALLLFLLVVSSNSGFQPFHISAAYLPL